MEAKHCAGHQWLAVAASGPSGSEAAASSGGASRPPTSQPRSPTSTLRPWEAQQRPGEDPHFAQSLSDLVRMVNFAGREGKGNVVWLGYNTAHPHSTRPPKPSQIAFGCNLVALTSRGAAQILHLMIGARPKHFDLWLLEMLQQHASDSPPASYVNPPIGSFETHVSGCSSLPVRASGFGRPWVWEGTRAPLASSAGSLASRRRLSLCRGCTAWIRCLSREPLAPMCMLSPSLNSCTCWTGSRRCHPGRWKATM